MNTILITGTARSLNQKDVKYDVWIWGALAGQPLQLITTKEVVNGGYNDIWKLAKDTAEAYLKEPRLQDGAYTQFLDHLIIRWPE